MKRSRTTAVRRVSAVVPVLNESRTIGRVVRFALRSPGVGEVLVIDDGSIDGTPELAEAAGARVITSSLLGKGASMEEGLDAARFDIVVYLDGDLRGLRRDLIPRLVAPIAAGEADFVKARFARSGGRVTMLTARPLLRTYFPELAEFSQPLGGIIAARRDVLRQLTFETDYGVDVGLLIDAARVRARLVEVDVGKVLHDSQSLEALEEMAVQVARTILERAAAWGRLGVGYLRDARERDLVRRADFRRGLDRVRGGDRLALFDMDGTLLNGRFIVELAYRTGRMEGLAPLLDNHTLGAAERSRRIAAVFAGVPVATFQEAARQMPLMPGAVETVVGLRKLGYRVGIVTDSYFMVADTVRRRVFADFVVSHKMRVHRNRATGRLSPSPAMSHPRGCPEHPWCKLNVLLHLTEELGIPVERVLAVGDGDNDACMVRAAGIPVAFNPKTPNIRDAARHLVEGDLRGILQIVGGTVSREPEIRPSSTAGPA